MSQLILRRRADRDGTALPLRMKGFPGLTIFGLVLLALIFAVGFSSPDSSKQLFSTLVLVAGIAAACWIGARITRNRNAVPPSSCKSRTQALNSPCRGGQLADCSPTPTGDWHHVCSLAHVSPRLIAHPGAGD